MTQLTETLLERITPITEVIREPDYWSRGHFYEGKRHTILVRNTDLPIGTKLYSETDIQFLLDCIEQLETQLNIARNPS